MNQAQKRAIAHTEGPCLVLAGPGSGKTLTIVNRIKYLIEKRRVRPEEILVITFTKYAAGEMKLRLQALMEGRRLPVTMGTFHGIYYGILKWAYHLGPHNILSEEEKYGMLRQIVSRQEAEVFDEEDFLQGIVTEIGAVKNHRANLEEYQAKHCPAETFRCIYREYETMRKEAKKIDFDDMLVLCYDLFRRRPDVLKLWQEKFRYILVDEFQDINQVQYDVIQMLAAPEHNLFVVGDDDQSIYGFRGADVKLMFRFLKDYPGAKQMLLDRNYRSTANIVRHALQVIGNNEVRFEKQIRTQKPAGTALHIQETLDSEDESAYVVSEIRQRMEAGIPPEQIAVLFRVHTDARALAGQLVKHRIPFFMRESMPDLYQYFIAKDIRAYLRLAGGGRDRADFLQVMNRPVRYLSRASVSGSRIVPFEELRKFYCDKDWMQDRIDQFEWDLKMMEKMAPYAAIQYIRKKVGYEEYLREYAETKGQQPAEYLELLGELEESARPFGTAEEWFAHMAEYTEALAKQKQKKQEAGTGVRLMTMHASKGLEFDTVFIIQANEGRIPYKRAVQEQGTEEERRLFYVAMTRAKEVLKISYVTVKNGKEAKPSRFVEELHPKQKETQGGTNPSGFY